MTYVIIALWLLFAAIIAYTVWKDERDRKAAMEADEEEDRRRERELQNHRAAQRLKEHAKRKPPVKRFTLLDDEEEDKPPEDFLESNYHAGRVGPDEITAKQTPLPKALESEPPNLEPSDTIPQKSFDTGGYPSTSFRESPSYDSPSKSEGYASSSGSGGGDGWSSSSSDSYDSGGSSYDD